MVGVYTCNYSNIHAHVHVHVYVGYSGISLKRTPRDHQYRSFNQEFAVTKSASILYRDYAGTSNECSLYQEFHFKCVLFNEIPLYITRYCGVDMIYILRAKVLRLCKTHRNRYLFHGP